MKSSPAASLFPPFFFSMDQKLLSIPSIEGTSPPPPKPWDPHENTVHHRIPFTRVVPVPPIRSAAGTLTSRREQQGEAQVRKLHHHHRPAASPRRRAVRGRVRCCTTRQGGRSTRWAAPWGCSGPGAGTSVRQPWRPSSTVAASARCRS
jgi:hypothetical protein